MQRYVQNQSKKVAKNKIVMETNANKTTLFFQLMRKRCFFVLAIKINHLLCRCVPKQL